MFLQEKKKQESYFKTVLNLRKENKLKQDSNKLLLQLLVNIVKLRTTKELVDKVYEVIFSLFIEDLNIIPRNKKLLLELFKKLKIQARNKKLLLESSNKLKIKARNRKILPDGMNKINIKSRNEKILLESLLKSLKLKSRPAKIEALKDFLENELSSLNYIVPLKLKKKKIK